MLECALLTNALCRKPSSAGTCLACTSLMKSLIYLLFSVPLLWCTLCFSSEKRTYGLHENVYLPELNLHLKAKLDTGAETASLSAHRIHLFTRSGERWVRFSLAIDQAHDITLERPLLRVSHIKRRHADHTPGVEPKMHTSRPVIPMVICMGNERHTIEVNLTNRSHFDFPLLIGSKALRRYDALIDVSRSYLAGTPACPI